jgi:hypothetical protein
MAVNDLLLVIDDDVIPTSHIASGHLRHHQQASDPLVVLGYMPPTPVDPRRAGDFPRIIYGTDYEGACRKYESDPSYVLRDLWGGNFSVNREKFLIASESVWDLPYHQDQVLGWALRSLGCQGVFDRELLAEHRYVRSESQFFNDCRRRGRALALLSTNSPPADADTSPTSSLSTPVRLAIKIVSNPRIRSRGIFYGLLKIAGRMRWWRMEMFAARFLRHVETYDAFVTTVSAGRSSSDPKI